MIFHSFARSNYFVQLKYRFSPPSPCRGSACEYVRLLPCRRPPLTPCLPPHPLHSTPCSQTTPDQRRKRIFRHPTPNKSMFLLVSRSQGSNLFSQWFLSFVRWVSLNETFDDVSWKNIFMKRTTIGGSKRGGVYGFLIIHASSAFNRYQSRTTLSFVEATDEDLEVSVDTWNETTVFLSTH